MTESRQQVSVNLVNMVYTAIAYLALAGAAWLFLRLVQACFWLPGHMKRQNDVQRMLQEKVKHGAAPVDGQALTSDAGEKADLSKDRSDRQVDSYERYIEECETRETAARSKDNSDAGGDAAGDGRSTEEKSRERRECLDMLKRELRRIQEGGDPYDFDYLLDEEEKQLMQQPDKGRDCAGEQQADEQKVGERQEGERKLATDDCAQEPKKNK